MISNTEILVYAHKAIENEIKKFNEMETKTELQEICRHYNIEEYKNKLNDVKKLYVLETGENI